MKLTKIQKILIEVYGKGLQNKDCNLSRYEKRIKKTLLKKPSVKPNTGPR